MFKKSPLKKYRFIVYNYLIYVNIEEIAKPESTSKMSYSKSAKNTPTPHKKCDVRAVVEQCSVCANQCSTDSYLVEMAVIETASENSFSELSTSVGYLLRFPRQTADKQAVCFGIL